MREPLRIVVARVRAFLGPDAAGTRQSLVALAISAVTALVAGLTLGTVTGTLEQHPGLLLLVPAAIAVRGNVFGALGSRLGTSIHAGTFTLTPRTDTVVGQNVLASLVLTVSVSLLLAVLAKGTAVAFGVPDAISVGDYAVVSVAGGALASLGVLAITLLLAAGSVRWGWDLDNVTAPLVTAASDVVTLPAIILAAALLDRGTVTSAAATATAVVGIGAAVAAVVSRLDVLKRIVQESIPILTVACVFDLVAGVFIEKRLGSFIAFPVLLVLLPGYLGTAGALGGILSSRIASKLHLGLVAPSAVPDRAARGDIGAVFGLAVPAFVLTALAAHFGGAAAGLGSPGAVDVVAVTLLGGSLATVFVAAVAYYGTIAAVRFGVDPDTVGIPMVTSSLDVVGSFSLVLGIVAVGVT